MLKIHQRLGLITMIPLIATVATSFGAGGRSTSTSDRWAHLALGSATGDLYFTTAYFAIFAPRIPGTQTRGQIRVHKALAWVHGPGMILTPILGAIAFDQRSKGEKSSWDRERPRRGGCGNSRGLYGGAFVRLVQILIRNFQKVHELI